LALDDSAIDGNTQNGNIVHGEHAASKSQRCPSDIGRWWVSISCGPRWVIDR